MAAAGRRAWRQFVFLLAVLPSCRSLEVSIPQKQYEIASGGDVTLTCSFVPARPELSIFVLTWEAYPDTVGEPLKPVATSFSNTAIDIAPSYEGRAVLNLDADARTSTLTLTKVTIQDSRNYQCSVLIPNDDEGTTAATTTLLVLVPPSPPICGIQGTAEYFQDIVLTCESKEGSPLPTYSWKTFSVENLPRAFPPKTVQKEGALSLFNITRETSGFFMCTSVNRIGSASCNFTLAVMPPSMNYGSTAGIIAGVAAGVILLAVVIYCCCRKKGNKDPNPERSPEDMEFRDKDAPEIGEQYRDDQSSSEVKQSNQYADKDAAPQNSHSVGQKFDIDQQSHTSGRASEVGSQRYADEPRDHYRGSRDRLDDQRDRHRGSQDRLDDQRDHYQGSQDRLDDQRDRYRGSQDRLDDQRDRYRGSQDRLDDQRDRYRGSQDRLDDQRDHYRGSRDRLDDGRNRYGGSRDRLDDHYRSSRDDVSGRGTGSRDRLDYIDDPRRNRYE